MNKLRQIAGLVVSLLIVFGIATLGGFLTNLSVATWYPSLDKPSWTPSGATIGTVWTILYTFMGIAAWIVWRERFWRPTTPAGDLCPPAPPECRMVGSILRPSEPRLGTSRDWHLVVSDSGNFRDVLESVEARWCADGPLSDLG